MQPAQMSLLPDQTPAPRSTRFLTQLPHPQIDAAVAELARLIAAAARTVLVEVDDD